MQGRHTCNFINKPTFVIGLPSGAQEGARGGSGYRYGREAFSGLRPSGTRKWIACGLGGGRGAVGRDMVKRFWVWVWFERDRSCE